MMPICFVVYICNEHCLIFVQRFLLISCGTVIESFVEASECGIAMLRQHICFSWNYTCFHLAPKQSTLTKLETQGRSVLPCYE